MEIYKLKDKVEVDKSAFRITDLKQGVKNPNRVNVYVNDKYAFSLDVAQVVDLGAKVGRVLTEAEMAEMKQASEFGKAYQRALEWVLMRPRSVKELKDYLKRRSRHDELKERKKEWDKEREIADLVAKGEEVDAKRLEKKLARQKAREKYDFEDLIVGRLCERGYVDDWKFAEYYVENRFVKKGVSRRRLEMELFKKGVSKEIIEAVMGGRDDAEEIRKMITKKRSKYDDEKLINYLVRQGFSYELARSQVRDCGKD